MSDEDTFVLNTKGLDQIVKSLKGKLPYIQIGIMGDKNARSGGRKTNAEIGAKHEFGRGGMPVRSFLRVPLSDNLGKYLEQSNAFDRDAMARVIKTGTILPWLTKVAVVAENVVADGFASGGFGKWPPSDMKRKKVHMTLVETQQLRNSISSRIK